MESLWRDNRRWIAAVLLAHKPAGADVDDLLQEVAVTLVAKINTLRDELNVRAWLRAIAVNVARAAGRNSRHRSTVALHDDGDQTAPGHDWKATLNDNGQRVLEAAQRLPEIYREPLMLRAVQGLRTRQIAEILGIEEAAVDTRISRARRILRQEMEQLENGERSAPHGLLRAPTRNVFPHNRLEVQP